MRKGPGFSPFKTTAQPNAGLGSWDSVLAEPRAPSTKHRAPSTETGFSLIEILFSAAILILLILGILGILQFANLTWNSDMGLLDLQQATRQAMAGIIREGRQADASRNITMAADGTSIQFYIPNYTDSITYSLNNNQIIRQHPVGMNTVLANDISSLSFCWMHADGSCTTDRDCAGLCSQSYSLQVQLRANKTVKQRALVFPIAGPLTEQVRLRNE